MQNEIPSSNGVHVAGSFQGWDPSKTILYSFVPGIYEIISYVTTGTYNYKFYNGNTGAIVETIPAPCNVFGNREVDVQYDTLLNIVCYGSCGACISTAGITDYSANYDIKLLPNPGSNYSLLSWNDNTYTHNVTLMDATGRTIRQYNNLTTTSLRIEKDNLEAGIYFVNIKGNDGSSGIVKLIFE